MKTLLIAVAIMAVFSSCASTSGIVPTGQDSYMISKEAGYGGGLGTLKAGAIQEGAQFCVKNGKQFQISNTDETPNAIGRYAHVDVFFMCLDSNDPGFHRTQMTPQPSKVVEIINK